MGLLIAEVIGLLGGLVAIVLAMCYLAGSNR